MTYHGGLCFSHGGVMALNRVVEMATMTYDF